jgi:hypothetical protein
VLVIDRYTKVGSHGAGSQITPALYLKWRITGHNIPNNFCIILKMGDLRAQDSK